MLFPRDICGVQYIDGFLYQTFVSSARWDKDEKIAFLSQKVTGHGPTRDQILTTGSSEYYAYRARRRGAEF